MKNNKFFFKDTASIITGALSTFADFKTEIDNVIKSRFEKFINSQGIVNREDFEALVDRHEKLNSEFILLKTKLENKNLKKEIDNIIKSRLEKFINSQGIVNREDFEALVDRHEKLNSEFILLKTKFENKNKEKSSKKNVKF